MCAILHVILDILINCSESNWKFEIEPLSRSIQIILKNIGKISYLYVELFLIGAATDKHPSPNFIIDINYIPMQNHR